MQIDKISTKVLSAQLDNAEFIILDIRPSAAYNGWKLQDEARAGHIRGAVCFPSSWIKALSAQELKTLLASKGVTSKKAIVMYGYQRDSCFGLAKALQEIGFRDIFVYEAGIEEWAADASLPMNRLANNEKLVYPEWVKNLISGRMTKDSLSIKQKLFEVSFEGFEKYKAGHIPGAYYFDLASIESAPTWNICPEDELLDFLLVQGITYDSLIVLYGRNPMAVARAASVMMYAGVEDVRILDGGLDAWLKDGYAVETGERQPDPAEDFGRSVPGHPEYIMDIDTVRALLADPQGALVNVRSWDEYIGKTSGYDYIKAKGHIPGDVWGHSGSGPHEMEDYRNPDNTMRSYHEIESNWQRAGITPDKNIAFYCGSGWRASEAFFCAYLMGRQKIAVYDGGWLEWSQDETNPIALEP